MSEKKLIPWLWVLVACVLSGAVLEGVYLTSPRRVIDMDGFRRQLARKETVALHTLQALQERVRTQPVDSLAAYPFPDDDIAYYIVQGDRLVFWSDNRPDISGVTARDFRDWHFLHLPNAYCTIVTREHDGLDFIALLTVKYDYPYENTKLINRFARGFDLDKRVGISVGSGDDPYPVYCLSGHYLFSLEPPAEPVYDGRWAVMSRMACGPALGLLLFLFAVCPWRRWITAGLALVWGLFLPAWVWWQVALPVALVGTAFWRAFEERGLSGFSTRRLWVWSLLLAAVVTADVSPPGWTSGGMSREEEAGEAVTLENYPNRYRSYSFPDLLLPAPPAGHALPDDNHRPVQYVQLFVCLALLCFALSRLLSRAALQAAGRPLPRMPLAARFQYTFLVLLVSCFAAVYYFSVDFLRTRYRRQQSELLERKCGYIQNALLELYYWNQTLDAADAESLHRELRELSYVYETDIHVFDNDGVLVATSQPPVFALHLVGNRISPQPYFAARPNRQQREHIGELDYLAAYTDFYNGDYLQIGYIAIPQFLSEENLRREIEHFSSVIIHIYLLIVLLAVLLTVVVGKRLSAPLYVLERKLKDMRLGQRNEKVEYGYDDEIGQLVAQYNRTVDELERSAHLLAQSERESAWRQMARQIAHEINNPLTPMKLSIQQLQRRKDLDDEGFDDYFRRTTSMLVEQIDNLSRIAGAFSDFARMPESRLARVDVGATLQSVVSLFAGNRERVGLHYHPADTPLWVMADGEQLIQVFNNLIKNAIQAIPKDREGRVEVSARRQGRHVLIAVADNGCGVSDEVRDKMFAPNFTTKAQGMGLGLAISKKIVEQCGGTITFETTAGEGSVFRVELPEG